MLPSLVPRLATDSAVRMFPVWKLLFFKTPFLGRISIPTAFVSLFIFYILSYLLSKTMGCLSGCLMSSASMQKLFCGVYLAFKCSFDEFVREKVVSPSYSSAIFRVCLCLFLISFFYVLMFMMVWVENLFSHSVVSDSATPLTAASQASLSYSSAILGLCSDLEFFPLL